MEFAGFALLLQIAKSKDRESKSTSDNSAVYPTEYAVPCNGLSERIFKHEINFFLPVRSWY
jgi:hypothetical protein